MFSTVWQKPNKRLIIDVNNSQYNVIGIVPMIWIEHCVECAAPLCYKTCKIYLPRADERCLRFENGVIAYPFPKEAITGGQISFRRWAKLEAKNPNLFIAVKKNRIEKICRIFNNIGYGIEKAMAHIRWNRHRPCKMIESALLNYMCLHKFHNTIPVDGFLCEVFNHEPFGIRIILEITSSGNSVYKNSYALQSGWNDWFIPLNEFNVDFNKSLLIKVYLENNSTGTFTFRYLDFVALEIEHQTKLPQPAKKVKCVAWDLDNTLWKGVIGDAKDSKVDVRPEVISMIMKLDSMGILQTIVSKNTFDIAWQKIEELGIADYFLYPAINWGRKSHNMLAIAKELNINIDTFALIDDSAFEREEVKSTLPQTRVYDIKELNQLLNYPEFDIPITSESALRRQSYIIECKRNSIKASYGDNYDTFLKDCLIQMDVFKPIRKKDRERCFELLQRSNQYNLCKERRTEEEYATLFINPAYSIFAIQVKDKFGDYGIVGFVTIEKVEEKFYCRDFVMSCRVAQKKIERAFWGWYIKLMPKSGKIYIDVYKTQKNKPLREELKKMPFIVSEDEEYARFSFDKSNGEFVRDEIINVNQL